MFSCGRKIKRGRCFLTHVIPEWEGAKTLESTEFRKKINDGVGRVDLQNRHVFGIIQPSYEVWYHLDFGQCSGISPTNLHFLNYVVASRFVCALTPTFDHDLRLFFWKLNLEGVA